MDITVTGHHVEVTDSLREYVINKFDRLQRHFDNVLDANVILTVEKLEQKAEATIHLTGNTIFADSVDENMYAAIDSLTDKLDRQIKKHKEKRKDHHKAEGAMHKTAVEG